VAFGRVCEEFVRFSLALSPSLSCFSALLYTPRQVVKAKMPKYSKGDRVKVKATRHLAPS